MIELEILQQGRRLIAQAAARQIPVRLVGGAAIWTRAGEPARAALGRAYPDLDFVIRRSDSGAFRKLMEEQAYEPERTFNAVHGAHRLLYHASGGGYQVDVFLDAFRMCHELDFRERLQVEELTVPAAELILTKLQIVQINRKDISDIAMLLWDHELAESDGPALLNAARVQALCGADWGLFTTVGDNLAKTREMVPALIADAHVSAAVTRRIDDLAKRLEQAPKTLAWKLRAKIGRKRPWYEMPEEVVR